MNPEETETGNPGAVENCEKFGRVHHVLSCACVFVLCMNNHHASAAYGDYTTNISHLFTTPIHPRRTFI